MEGDELGYTSMEDLNHLEMTMQNNLSLVKSELVFFKQPHFVSNISLLYSKFNRNFHYFFFVLEGAIRRDDNRASTDSE
jgi:hypothetical protein